MKYLVSFQFKELQNCGLSKLKVGKIALKDEFTDRISIKFSQPLGRPFVETKLIRLESLLHKARENWSDFKGSQVYSHFSWKNLKYLF